MKNPVNLVNPVKTLLLCLALLAAFPAAAAGWKVFVEPGTTHTVSAKFKNLPPGEALRLLLGDLNFALIPETNASPKLFVFRTSQGNATQLVRAPKSGNGRGKIIPNELIVTLKP